MSEGIGIELNVESLNSTLEILTKVGQLLKSPTILEALLEWGKLIETEAKNLAPVKTGKLRDEISSFLLVHTAEELTVKVSTTPQGGAGSAIPYYLEYGTQAHWVAPVRAKSLHWLQDGEHHFSKGHMVSGIKAHFFMFRAFVATRKEGEELLAQAILKATEETRE